MSYFKFQEYQVYYQVEGEGKPLVILNGIMMSTKSWQPFMPSLLAFHKVIRVDFLDQGQSDKLVGKTYTQQLQVEMLVALFQHMQLNKVNIVGISYGGEVALQLACDYPELVDRLVLFNTTAYTSPWLSDIGKGWMSSGKTRDAMHYYYTAIPVIYSPHFYEKHLSWMRNREQALKPIFSNPAFLDAMERLTLSADHHDLMNQLQHIVAPTLIVSAEQDYLTPMHNQEFLYRQIKQAQWVKIPEAGHASMYEKPLLFTTLVIGFINALDVVFNI